jgi:Mce-associated membrane protein
VTEAEAVPRSGHRPLRIVAAVAVLLAAATAVLGFLVATDDDGSARVDDLRRTAGQFAEALVTYDFEDPEAHRDAVLSFATGSFREEYEDAFDRGLGPLIADVEAVSQGYVKDIYVSEIDQDQAQAVVSVDIEHQGVAGARSLFDIYFRLTFVEVGGEWRVDQVTDLNFGQPAPGPEATTETSVPVDTSVP